MSHIPLPDGMPGIRALFAFREDTAKPLCDLADILLREENSLSQSDRELIATYVSSQNDCYYCQNSHGAVAEECLGGDEQVVIDVKRDYRHARISEKLKALIAIAGLVQEGGKHVTAETIALARTEGATDGEIHDTVLIAAAFCMYNRYVDGLAAWAPDDPQIFRDRAKRVVKNGYGLVPRNAPSNS
jgi:uncharacterized peroxidase-related enzyme